MPLRFERWRKAFPDDQILVTFAAHFKTMPQAVVYFIEDFVGNIGKRHHVYTPHISNGYYVLGYYSKAGKPSHKDPIPEGVQTKLKEYFAPWNKKLRDLLLSSNIRYEPVNPIPKEYLQGNRLTLPSWLVDA
mmetsp:Transcript_4127/g.5184  ORF Transcript_4127/g.5184 Transcript_4127/m.5184 type:complete len:132 (+) Transcript_4127:15-410(+)